MNIVGTAVEVPRQFETGRFRPFPPFATVRYRVAQKICQALRVAGIEV